MNNKKGKDKGATLVEYALLVALIAVICLVGLRQMGKSTNVEFYNARCAMNGQKYSFWGGCSN